VPQPVTKKPVMAARGLPASTGLAELRRGGADIRAVMLGGVMTMLLYP